MKQQSGMWYGSRKEPNLQISIMKEIGINGKQTKADLSRNLSKTTNSPTSYATIDTTLSRNDEIDDFTKLFWRNGTVTKQGKQQTLYSLTPFGITCLLKEHYKQSGKPFLNLKEYSKFISIYDKEHSVFELGDKIPFSSFSHIYFAFNPTITVQLISKFKDNNELQKLNSSIKYIESKTKQLEEEKNSKILETYELLTSLLTPSNK